MTIAAETPTTLGLTPEDNRQLTTARARRSLLEAPELILFIRLLVTPRLGGQQDGLPRPASKNAPLPLRAEAVDDTDDLFARLLEWVDYWAAAFKTPAPSIAQVHRSKTGEPAGFRSSTTADGAAALTKQLTLWLLARHDLIAQDNAGLVYFEDIAEMAWKLRGRYPMTPRAPRGVIDRPCPVCDQFAYGASWTGESATDFELRCSHCEHTEDAATFLKHGRVRELMHELREEHAEPKAEWWTKRQATLELSVNVRTIDRYITDGLRTLTHAGTVYVPTDELLALWRAKRLRMKSTQHTAVA